MSGRKLLFVVVTVLLVLAARLNAARVDGPPMVPVVPRHLAAGIAPDAGPATVQVLVSRATLEPALRDPFAAMRPAPTPAIGPASARVAPAALTSPAPPARPEPPTPGLAFAGRMVTPDGGTLVLASLGNETLTLRPGQLLPNGFRVDAIDAAAVLLSHPALAQPARLAIPPAPRLQTR